MSDDRIDPLPLGVNTGLAWDPNKQELVGTGDAFEWRDEQYLPPPPENPSFLELDEDQQKRVAERFEKGILRTVCALRFADGMRLRTARRRENEAAKKAQAKALREGFRNRPHLKEGGK